MTSFAVLAFLFSFPIFFHFRFQSFSIFSFLFRFSFRHFFILVLVFANEFVIFLFSPFLFSFSLTKITLRRSTVNLQLPIQLAVMSVCRQLLLLVGFTLALVITFSCITFCVFVMETETEVEFD